MRPGQFARASALFLEARAMTPEARPAFLEQACPGDPEVRREAERLLAHDVADDPSAGPWADRAGDGPPLPERIGGIAIERVLGAGGMGVVYLGRQERPRRTVAVKVLRAGVATRAALRRFEHEAEALARLHHPNIAQIYAAGTHDAGDGGVPWFAMEYVPDAQTIVAHAASRRLDVPGRLRLFLSVCDAVEHGHRRGIIHRDLKPANILVDPQGEPRIIDFGIARVTDSDLAVTSVRTEVGQIVGTLPYMSPEQFAADPHDIDTRSDVYALGVVLYELLCERRPHDFSGAAIAEAARVVRDETPPRPGTVDRRLRGNLEAIMLTALDKDRKRRYASAVALADDVRRFLRHEPIAARPPTLRDHLRSLSRRHRAAMAATAAIAITLLAATVVSLVFAVKAGREATRRGRAEAAAREAASAATAARKAAETQRDAALARAYTAAISAADASIQANAIVTARRRLDLAPAGLRGWEWDHYSAQLDHSVATLPAPARHVIAVAFAEAPDRLVGCAASGRFRRALGQGGLVVPEYALSSVVTWDRGSAARAEILDGGGRRVTGLAFAAGFEAIMAGTLEGAVRFGLGGDALARVSRGGVVTAVASGGDGRRIAIGDTDGVVTVIDGSSGRGLATITFAERAVRRLALSADGARLAAALDEGTVEIRDTASGARVGPPLRHETEVLSLAFDPAGERLASAGEGHPSPRIWDVAGGELLRALHGHDGTVRALAFSPDGTRVASGATDGTVRLWRSETGRGLCVFRGHEGAVHALAFDRDGTALASGGEDFSARLWDTSGAAPTGVLGGHEGAVTGIAAHGERIVSGGRDGNARVWDALSGEHLATLRGYEGAVTAIAVSPDGALVATGTRFGAIVLWDTATGEPRRRLRGHTMWVTALTFGPGDQLASGSPDRTIRLWDVTDGSAGTVLRGHRAGVRAVAFEPGATVLVSAAGDETIRRWDLRRGLVIAEIASGRVGALAVEPESGRLAAAGLDGSITLWDLERGEAVGSLRGHERPVTSVLFARGGRRIVSGSVDGTVRLWDAASGDELAILRHDSAVSAVTMSGDGTRLAAGGTDGTVRTWDRRPASERFRQRRQRGADPAGRLLRQHDEIRGRARPIVEALFARHVLLAPTLRAIDRHPGLDEATREAARRVARWRGDEPRRLNDHAWSIVAEAGGDAETYEAARQGAEAAAAADPDDMTFVNTLGVARYRTGDPAGALEALRRSDAFHSGSRAGFPGDVAFIAMAHHRLGHADEAAAALDRLRTIMSAPARAGNDTFRGFLREAEALIEGEGR